MTAASSNGGTITYSSNTPTTCTVNATTGAVALTGQAAGGCTIKATSNLTGNASALRNISITPRTLAASSCTPDDPRVGDVITQTVNTKNNMYNTPRDVNGTSGAPSNPVVRDMPAVDVTYNYNAIPGGAAGTRLTTTATIGGSPGAAGTRWDGFAPLPLPAALPNKHSTSAVTFYDFDTAGNITTPVYWQPKTDSKLTLTDIRTGVQEYYPLNWQNQFASMVTAGMAANTTLGTLPVTVRVVGGWLNGKAFVKSGAGLSKASYQNTYYDVTATYKGRSATETVTTANGKLIYNNLCQIDYKFVLKPISSSLDAGIQNPSGPADLTPETPTTSVNAAYINNVWAADVTATKDSFGVTATKTVLLGGTRSFGDATGTFYTHNNIPRVIKDDKIAIATVSGGAAQNGSGSTPQGNQDYYTEPGGGGINPSSFNAQKISSITRINLP